jgi:hypothetical protein
MIVGIKHRYVITEIGTADFLHAVFSTISGNLEPNGWGTQFPVLMKKLYFEELTQSDARPALMELGTIIEGLSKLSIDSIVWDAADHSKRPSPVDKERCGATILSDYFITTTGREFLPTLEELLIDLRDAGGTLKVVEMPGTQHQVTFIDVPTSE